MPLPPIIPWEPSHVPIEIQDEMDRRRRNISMNFVSPQGSWEKGDWKKYTGPMTAWARLCSNGNGKGSEYESNGKKKITFDRPRFVLFGGKDFESTYGFKRTTNSSNEQIIGYMPDGRPHTLPNDTDVDYPIHVPAPEISRVEMIIQKEILRRAVVEWTCFSWKQLEYLTPYFLTPRITVMLEIGWNHFNPESLVDISQKSEMIRLWDDPYPLYLENIIKSRGNYDVIYGIVSNFNWSVEGNNRYICSTEITSKNRLYAGLIINSEMIVKGSEKVKEEKMKTLGNLSDFLSNDNTITNFSDFARYGKDEFLKRSKPETRQKTYVVQMGATPDIDIPSVRTYTETTKPEVEITPSFFNEFFDRAYWYSIDEDEKRIKNGLNAVKLSYLYSVFDGRSEQEQNISNTSGKASSGQNNLVDFDNAENKTMWFSMGLVSTIFNIFSERSSGSPEKSLFSLNIDDTLIGAHKNLISANGTIMIVPNAESPKFFWGPIRSKLPREKFEVINEAYLSQYIYQYKGQNSPADETLKNVCHQSYAARDNLDIWINRNLYRTNPEARASQNEDRNYYPPNVGTRSFPNKPSETGESKPCGFLRDIYVNVDFLKSVVEDKSVENYYEFVQRIIEELNRASGRFWDLKMVDNGSGEWTIADQNFVGSRNIKNNNKPLIFDMHSSDNIIKSFKFRPQMTDAQAMRAIFAADEKAKFQITVDLNTVDFVFTDSILPSGPEDDEKSKLEEELRFANEWENTLNDIQVVDDKSQGDTFQMKIPIRDKTYAEMLPPFNPPPRPDQNFLYLKFALPIRNGVSILGKLLDDKDYANNYRYCAIQPGINAELTLQGIGGLRTFQCFLIRNLPAPYSHKNIVFQIINVMDHIESGTWETTIVAGIRPLRQYIIDTLQLSQVK